MVEWLSLHCESAIWKGDLCKLSIMHQCLWIDYIYFDGLKQFSLWDYSNYEVMKKKKDQNIPVGNLQTVWILGMFEICVCPGEGRSPVKASILTVKSAVNFFSNPEPPLLSGKVCSRNKEISPCTEIIFKTLSLVYKNEFTWVKSTDFKNHRLKEL